MDNDLVKIPENITPTLTLANRIAQTGNPAPQDRRNIGRVASIRSFFEKR
jgi:hypothetical protein